METQDIIENLYLVEDIQRGRIKPDEEMIRELVEELASAQRSLVLIKEKLQALSK